MNESMLCKHLGDLDCPVADGISKEKMNNQKLQHRCYGDLELQFVKIIS